MKQRQRMFASLSLVSLVLFTACGGRESVASRSAAAYDEATRKGIRFGGGLEHGAHAADEAAAEGLPGMDHSQMQGGSMTGMDHSQMRSGGVSDDSMSTAPAEAASHEGRRK